MTRTLPRIFTSCCRRPAAMAKRPFGLSGRLNVVAGSSRLSCPMRPRARARCLFSARTASTWVQRAIWGQWTRSSCWPTAHWERQGRSSRLLKTPRNGYRPIHRLIRSMRRCGRHFRNDGPAGTRCPRPNRNQLKEALSCVETRSQQEVDKLAKALHGPLIGHTQSHGTTISSKDAKGFGLPVREAAQGEAQWREIWRLWTKYRALGDVRVYEGEHASVIVPRTPATT